MARASRVLGYRVKNSIVRVAGLQIGVIAFGLYEIGIWTWGLTVGVAGFAFVGMELGLGLNLLEYQTPESCLPSRWLPRYQHRGSGRDDAMVSKDL